MTRLTKLSSLSILSATFMLACVGGYSEVASDSSASENDEGVENEASAGGSGGKATASIPGAAHTDQGGASAEGQGGAPAEPEPAQPEPEEEEDDAENEPDESNLGAAGAGGDSGDPDEVIECEAGYVLGDAGCVDIDECAGKNWCAAGACVNDPGGFHCDCPPGDLGEGYGPGSCVSAPGLLLWLDGASPLEGEVVALGSALDTWRDRSGNEHHATQANVLRQPKLVKGPGGISVVRFDGAYEPEGDGMDIDNDNGDFDLTDATVFAVISPRFDSYHTAPGFFGVRDEFDARMSLHVGANGSYLLLWNGTDLISTDPNFVEEQSYFVDVTWSAGTETARVNGVEMSSLTHPWNVNQLARGVHVGWSGRSDEHLDGDIGELIVYDGALDAGQRDAVYGYLQKKWTTPIE